MYSSVLSLLLLGLWSSAVGSIDQLAITDVTVSPPTEEIAIGKPLSASGAVIIDADSGQVVFAKQEAVSRPMASITKLMTALIIVENHALTEVVRVPDWIQEIGGNTADLEPGEHFTVGNLLSALLVLSANDAAATLAVHHSGSLSKFADVMNSRAVILGLRNTAYKNPTGFDNDAQYSTPQDIAWLTAYVLKEPEIAKRMEMSWTRIYSLKGRDIGLNHTHALLHEKDSPVIAGKTGTTGEAGECLVSLIEGEDRSYIAVLMKSNQRYKDMEVILEELVPERDVVAAKR